MTDTDNQLDPVVEDARKKHFETLFDGDEIDGKTYKLGDVVTGLDAPTAAYLSSIGRISELSEEGLANKKRERRKAPELTAAQKAQAAADEARKAVAEKIAAGNADADLMADGKPLADEKLAEIAEKEKIDLSKAKKGEFVLEIMLARSNKA